MILTKRRKKEFMSEFMELDTFLSESLAIYRVGAADTKFEELRVCSYPFRAMGRDHSLRTYANACIAILTPPKGESNQTNTREIYSFLLWFSGLLLEPDELADGLHTIGIYFLGKEHPWFTHMVFRREWQLRRSLGAHATHLSDLYLQLALATDEIDSKIRVGIFLKASTRCAENPNVIERSADLALRLSALWCSLQGNSLEALILLNKAEKFVADVYVATPLQVFLAWVSAICVQAFQLPGEPRPRLFFTTIRALMDIGEKQDPAERLLEFDSLIHAVDRTGHGHLGVLSMAATMRIVQETDNHGLSREDQLIIKNNFGNALLTGEWNESARSVFESLINTLPTDWLTDSVVLFQLGHAYAGVGYSYYNEGKTSNATDANASFSAAAKAFDQATAAILASGKRTFHEARIWACKGINNFNLGEIEKGHEDFAHAMLIGNGVKNFSPVWESMVGVDYDTPLKYCEALSIIGAEYAAVFFAKLAVLAVHKASMPELSGDGAEIFIGSRSSAHRKLIELLSNLGRFNEAEHVFDLLRLTVHERATRQSLSIDAAYVMTSITSIEREVLQGVHALFAQDNTDDQGVEFDAKEIAKAFSQMDSELRTRFKSQIPEPDYSELVNRLGSKMHRDAALVRYVVIDTKLLISVVYCGSYHHLSLVVNSEDINTLAFALRQQCRAYPYAQIQQILEVSSQLYQILIRPIVDELNHLPSMLYLELDAPLNAVPFSILFDGNCYLCQKTTVLNLVRQGPTKKSAPETKPRQMVRAAVFASSSGGGLALPGAILEASIVHQSLVKQNRFESVELLIGSDCTVGSLLDELSRPFGDCVLIHLASHATFNASDEELSAFVLNDGNVSLRELRERLSSSRVPPLLMVLSACGTARTDVDVEGFTTMLLRNGVGTTISTLWESLDESAPDFFDKVYKCAFDPTSARSVAAAIRVAVLMLLDGTESQYPSWYAHPANWAPYVVTTTSFS